MGGVGFPPMPGLRIKHPTARNATVLVPHPGDVNGPRKPKDYRLDVDSEGCVIVSAQVWQRLLQARAAGTSLHEFLVLNEVKDPPAQTVDFLTPGVERRVFRQSGTELQDLGATVMGGPPNGPDRS